MTAAQMLDVAAGGVAEPSPPPARNLIGFFLDTAGNPFFNDVFSPSALELLRGVLDLNPRIVTARSIAEMQTSLEDAEVLLGTWGFPVELADQLARLPRLRIVLYAGGSVKSFARPFLERGIPVINGRRVNARAVAEFCLAQIILSNKGYFRNTRMCRFPESAHQTVAYTGPGNHGETVALLGYGLIARELRALLRMLPLRVIVVDPTLDKNVQPDEAIELVSMEEAFSEASVISSHLPDLPGLERCITGKHFGLMREGATFINTGRGRQVDERALAGVFDARKDLTALLDVSDPEPPLSGSPLYTMANVQLSSHIAGLVGNERQRLVDVVVAELERFIKGLPLQHDTQLDELASMA